MGDVVLGELIRETPASFARLADLVSAQSAIDIYLVVAKEERRPDALRDLQQLRDAGLRVDYPLTPMKVGRQFQTAEAMGARVTLLYGDEWPAVKMKTLATAKKCWSRTRNCLVASSAFYHLERSAAKSTDRRRIPCGRLREDASRIRLRVPSTLLPSIRDDLRI